MVFCPVSPESSRHTPDATRLSAATATDAPMWAYDKDVVAAWSQNNIIGAPRVVC